MRTVQIASLKLTRIWKYLQCKHHSLMLYKYGYETSQTIQAHPTSSNRQDWKHQHISSTEKASREDLTRAGSWSLRNKPLFRKNRYNFKILITSLLYLLQENNLHFLIFTDYSSGFFVLRCFCLGFSSSFSFFFQYICMRHNWHVVTQ